MTGVYLIIPPQIMPPQTALIMLAAGASTRMGQPKQLLTFQGKALLRHVTEIAIASSCQPIVVVLGANDDAIQPVLQDLPIHLVHNPHWSEGMGSSIQCGMQYISSYPNPIDAAILTVCDQPFISAFLLDQLVRVYRSSQSPIVASAYSGTLGVPALFDRHLFPDLLTLDSAQGAKSIINRHGAIGIDFPQGNLDLDTPEDYAQLLPFCS
jgi:molybdenum cofactor cytidylyltransferase